VTCAYDHPMMPPVIVLVTYALAVARVTTLITHDEITRPVREALIHRFNPIRRAHRLAVYLLGEPDGDTHGCPWCVSIWVGAVTAPIVWGWGSSPLVLIPMLGLAVSQVTGMIYVHGRQ
jgi:hypothetical protein